MSEKRNLRGTIVRAFISAAILFWLSAKVEWSEIGRVFADCRWDIFALGLVPVLMIRFLTAYKWQLLIEAKGEKVGYRHLLWSVWVSNFLGSFLPATAGGDAVRMYSLGASSGRHAEAVSSVAMDRITGAVSMMVAAFVGALWAAIVWGRNEVLIVMAAPAFAVAAMVAFLIVPGLQNLADKILNRFNAFPGIKLIREAYSALCDYKEHGRILGVVFALALMNQLMRVLIVWSLAKSTSMSLSFADCAILVPPALLVSMLPISIAGWGVREGALVYFLNIAGAAAPAIFAVALLMRLLIGIGNLPGVFMYLKSGLNLKVRRSYAVS
ncbi:MAG: lysylphosphatidylglycerol synthase transmembrane domain-containing protein [Candidatus Omnitrophota bacterium]|nr:lysylphosphatidylglycerol synthase transmembrane domain-containing protein [Candidatus Omnitrophota bacterium]